jgi:sulfite reductase (NADPH) hemoprotein beta-component
MSSEQELTTHGRARLSFASEADIDEFVAVLERYERGEMTPDQWRVFRLVRGTYGQRQAADAQMLRVKIPQGVITSAQLGALAEVGERYSRKFGHITTRQNIQFHFVKLHDVEPAMRLLADAGITTREACGNSVRNITTCPYAGAAADERFDVTPYAEATTRFLLRHRLSSTLPRKFKIAFEGCPEDHTVIAINDLAFHAQIGEGGERGFRVLAGGGTAIMCKSAGIIHEYLPASEILRACEAVLRVFKERGDYQHKQRNRMKFMIKELGWDVWYDEYQRALADCRADGTVPLLTIDPPATESTPMWERPEAPAPNLIVSRVATAPPNGPGITPTLVPVLLSSDEAYQRWRITNVRAQKQFGYVLATATVPLGDLTSEQMRVIGELADAYGDGTVRVTVDQDLVFRWVSVGALRELYRRLAAARSDCRGRRRAHQDQRMPERVRPASHCDDRFPGQRASRRRESCAAVLRDGRWRDDRARCQLRADRGENSGAPDSRSARAADRALSTREKRSGIRARVFSAFRSEACDDRAR